MHVALVQTLLPVFLLPILAVRPNFTTMDMSNLLEKGVTAYEAGDYQTALQHWQLLAENNDLAALRNIGHLYRRGLAWRATRKPPIIIYAPPSLALPSAPIWP